MQTRRMGRTGLKVSEICLGTMTFGHQCDEETSFAIMNKAAEHGVYFIDTADVYPVPPSPETAGPHRGDRRPLAQGPARPVRAGDQVPHARRPRAQRRGAVAPPHPRGRARTACAACKPITSTSTSRTAPIRTRRWRRRCGRWTTWCARARSAISAARTIPAWQVALALGISERHGWARFDCVQPRYNLLYREIESELLPLCRDQGLGVIAYNPLAGGFLTRQVPVARAAAAGDALHARQDGRTVPRALLAAGPARSGRSSCSSSSSRAASRCCRRRSPGCWPSRASPRRSSAPAGRSSSTRAWPRLTCGSMRRSVPPATACGSSCRAAGRRGSGSPLAA